jgi:Ran GTPase-activating protein (RanGAP) involved in mRNA processing and transport
MDEILIIRTVSNPIPPMVAPVNRIDNFSKKIPHEIFAHHIQLIKQQYFSVPVILLPGIYKFIFLKYKIKEINVLDIFKNRGKYGL